MSARAPVRLLVFDCDGTLSDGQAAVCNAMVAAFASRELTAPDLHQVRRMVGLSLPQAMRQLAPAESAESQMALVEAYKHAFRAARADGSLHEPLFPGMADLLHALHAEGWMLAVATGKSDRGLASTLEANGLTALFSSLQTADRHPSKPHPAMLEACLAETMAEPGNTLVIGDTVYDMEMAKSAGVGALGVAWGYHEADELLAAGASAVANDAQALRELIYVQINH